MGQRGVRHFSKSKADNSYNFVTFAIGKTEERTTNSLNDAVSIFLDTIQRFHDDNETLDHFARSPEQSEFRTNPLTAFVYEFFLYNSLYQIDWNSTLEPDGLVYHNRDRSTEDTQQDIFEEFLLEHDPNGINFRTGFRSFAKMSLSGDWTNVVPDKRITEKLGKTFFWRIKVTPASG